MNLCPQWKDKHYNKGHKIVNYELLSYICIKHNCAFFVDMNNNVHEIMSFQSLYERKNYIKYELDEMKSKVEQFNKIKNEIQNILDDTKSNLDLYYNINFNIFNNCTKHILNYEVLANLNKIK